MKKEEKDYSGIYAILVTVMVLINYYFFTKLNIDDYWTLGVLTYMLATIRYKQYKQDK